MNGNVSLVAAAPELPHALTRKIELCACHTKPSTNRTASAQGAVTLAWA